MHRTQLILLILLLSGSFSLWSQDPFFNHFYGNEAHFNPALTGYRGAFSINLKARQQWHSSDLEGYRTLLLTMEESMPCSFFDYGLAILQDVEGCKFRSI